MPQSDEARNELPIWKKPRVWFAILLYVTSMGTFTAAISSSTWSVSSVNTRTSVTYAETGPFQRCIRVTSNSTSCFGIFAANNVSFLIYITQMCVPLTFVTNILAICLVVSLIKASLESRALQTITTVLSLTNFYLLFSCLILVICYAIGDRSDITFLMSSLGHSTFTYYVTSSYWMAGFTSMMYLLSFVILSLEFSNKDTLRLILLT